MATLRERCSSIELLVLDVDGVLTAGGIIYGSISGEASQEIKAFHVRDGSGLKQWHAAGKRSAIITGRRSSLVAVRAAELGIASIIQGAEDKMSGLLQLEDNLSLPASAICYIGDDTPDVPVMQRVGLAVAVADACPEALRVAHHVTRAGGGSGAVRETIERILRCQGRWR